MVGVVRQMVQGSLAVSQALLRHGVGTQLNTAFIEHLYKTFRALIRWGHTLLRHPAHLTPLFYLMGRIYIASVASITACG